MEHLRATLGESHAMLQERNMLLVDCRLSVCLSVHPSVREKALERASERKVEEAVFTLSGPLLGSLPRVLSRAFLPWRAADTRGEEREI